MKFQFKKYSIILNGKKLKIPIYQKLYLKYFV